MPGGAGGRQGLTERQEGWRGLAGWAAKAPGALRASGEVCSRSLELSEGAAWPVLNPTGREAQSRVCHQQEEGGGSAGLGVQLACRLGAEGSRGPPAFAGLLPNRPPGWRTGGREEEPGATSTSMLWKGGRGLFAGLGADIFDISDAPA